LWSGESQLRAVEEMRVMEKREGEREEEGEGEGEGDE
jgi:hypothetical protein